MSFPYTLVCRMTFYGYPINAFAGSQAGVGDLLYTFQLKDIQRGWGETPFQFGRLSISIRAQAANISDLTPKGIPWSAGIEFIQNIMAVHI